MVSYYSFSLPHYNSFLYYLDFFKLQGSEKSNLNRPIQKENLTDKIQDLNGQSLDNAISSCICSLMVYFPVSCLVPIVQQTLPSWKGQKNGRRVYLCLKLPDYLTPRVMNINSVSPVRCTCPRFGRRKRVRDHLQYGFQLLPLVRKIVVFLRFQCSFASFLDASSFLT